VRGDFQKLICKVFVIPELIVRERDNMKILNWLLLICLTACLVLSLGCDRKHSRTSNTTRPQSLSGSPDTKILPYESPNDTNPIDDLDDEDDPSDDLSSGGTIDPGDGGNGQNGQQPVPEPSTLILVGSGIAIISLCRNKKKKQKNI